MEVKQAIAAKLYQQFVRRRILDRYLRSGKYLYRLVCGRPILIAMSNCDNVSIEVKLCHESDRRKPDAVAATGAP